MEMFINKDEKIKKTFVKNGENEGNMMRKTAKKIAKICKNRVRYRQCLSRRIGTAWGCGTRTCADWQNAPHSPSAAHRPYRTQWI
jgi:hypothetical protein